MSSTRCPSPISVCGSEDPASLHHGVPPSTASFEQNDTRDKKSFDISETIIELSDIAFGTQIDSLAQTLSEPPTYNCEDESSLENTGHHLHQSRQIKWILYSTNVALIVLPLSFMVLAFLAVRLDGTPVSARSTWVLQVAQIGPTIYPIMFTAIVGRLMNDIALYRVERGARLGTIEQLIQSDSLASAIKTAFILRNRAWGGVLIIVVWLFSPLGGQSSLRVLSEIDSFSVHNQTIIYTTGDSLSSSPFDIAAVSNLIQATLRSPQTAKNGYIDPWQNVKMPAHSNISGQTPTDGGNGSAEWFRLDLRDSDSYTALAGVPLWGLPRIGNVSFTIPWTFLQTECEQIPDAWDKWCSNQTQTDRSFCFRQAQNGTFRNGTMWTMNWPSDRFLNATDPPEYAKLQSWLHCTESHSSSCSSMFECPIKSVHTDVNVSCTTGLCQATAMRMSSTNLRPDFLTPWTEWLDIAENSRKRDVAALSTFVESWSDVVGSNENGTALVDSFLSASNQSDIAIFFHDIANTTADEFSIRTTQMLNTYWQAAQYYRDISSRQSDVFPYSTRDMVETDGHRDFYADVTAEVKTGTRMYKGNRIWIVLLIYISFILMVCTVASIIMQSKTKAPDILGYVSTLTRDNVYFEHCQAGSTLDGASRARALQDLIVYVADVRPHMKVGRIALSTGRTGGMPHGRLDDNRKYD